MLPFLFIIFIRTLSGRRCVHLARPQKTLVFRHIRTGLLMILQPLEGNDQRHLSARTNVALPTVISPQWGNAGIQSRGQPRPCALLQGVCLSFEQNHTTSTSRPAYTLMHTPHYLHILQKSTSMLFYLIAHRWNIGHVGTYLKIKHGSVATCIVYAGGCIVFFCTVSFGTVGYIASTVTAATLALRS